MTSKRKTSVKAPATPDALAKGGKAKGAELNEKQLGKVSGGRFGVDVQKKEILLGRK